MEQPRRTRCPFGQEESDTNPALPGASGRWEVFGLDRALPGGSGSRMFGCRPELAGVAGYCPGLAKARAAWIRFGVLSGRVSALTWRAVTLPQLQ